MKVLLIHKTQKFDLEKKSLSNEDELIQDLGLEVLFKTMASGDGFLHNVCHKTIFSYADTNIETAYYRQEILKDCMNNPHIVRSLYDLTLETIERKKNIWYFIFSKKPTSVLSSSIRLMEVHIDILKKLRNLSQENQSKFKSEGFIRFFKMILDELNEDYFAKMQSHLKTLEFKNEMSINGELGKGHKGKNYKLVNPPEEEKSWWNWLFPKKSPYFVFEIHRRDNPGIRILGELRDQGLNDVANALAQSNDHIFDFLNTLRVELAFYLGCINLKNSLTYIDSPLSFPTINPREFFGTSFTGLYDISLALNLDKRIVGNELQANDTKCVIITGANQGGKTTFLRSIGLAQMMMQSGMFVPAQNFSGTLCTRLFTHFKRQEDSTMESGKLDEELNRMDQIIKEIKPNGLLLFNESFASTNEIEGSAIAGQIVKALVEKEITVFFVTHLYDFANDFYAKKDKNILFLRAERKPDGQRTFELILGEPLQTSYGIDLYDRIFKNEIKNS